MVITYHGGEFVKITHGDRTLAFNPISKDSTLAGPKFGVDVVLVTLKDEDFNGVSQVTYGEKEPFVIDGPGEYEVEKIFIKGFPSVSRYKKRERLNTIYIVTLEGMNVCFLGALSEKQVDPKIFEDSDDIDILFVPIGGGGVLNPAEAHDVAVKLEPKIVIPMHYPSPSEKNGIGEKDSLKTFLKERGVEKAVPMEKLTIKKKDVEGKEGDVIVLSS
ncbi:MBL fold metallo-hydrolase [Candidatus Kaiserbacteria bacterium]|nr:MBL fold metallo-hydrolase [Candidatus Kaiserbacteria bacterium]